MNESPRTALYTRGTEDVFADSDLVLLISLVSLR